MDINISGIKILLETEDFKDAELLKTAYDPFITREKRKADLRIIVKTGSRPDPKPSQVIFDPAYGWKLSSFRKGYFYTDRTPQKIHLRQAIINNDFKRIMVYCHARHAKNVGVLNWVFDIPLGQFLMSHILAGKQGLIFHACGVKYQGQGLIFMGPSEAGKSTLADLWQKVKGAVVLSDERVILRRIKNRFWIFGTPWTGSSFAYANDRALLTRIFLIRHARKNYIKPLNIQDVLPVFFGNTRLPLWDKDRANKVMAIANLVLSSTPVFQLGFKPTNEIIDLILSLTNNAD